MYNDKEFSLNLGTSLNENIKTVKGIFKEDKTIIYRSLQNKYLDAARGYIIYIDGLVNVEVVNENIIQPFLNNDLRRGIIEEELLYDLQSKVILSNEVSVETAMDKIVAAILIGDTALLLEDFDECLIIGSKGWQTRSIDEPSSEQVIRGPREGFNESLITNLSLLRRKIQTPDLRYEFKELGTITKTKICICYLEEVASDFIIRELYQRLEQIQLDGIMDSGYIQELIKDSPYLPFKTIGNTERPDVVAAKLLEGRVAIIVEGSPNALTLPFIFLEYFQFNEDYFQNYIMGSINRLVRVIGFFLTVSVPAIYVSLVTFHQEMIPTTLILSIASARQGVPFPTIVEAIGMLIVFEILRESGARMPLSMGQPVSILGALVLGQAAVEARFISSPMVIIIAIVGITGLLMPKLKGVSITLRLIFLLLAAFLGLYGYIFGLIGFLLIVFSMRSFGVPYMLNIGSLQGQEFKDTVIRAPWWFMKYRPKIIGVKNYTRQLFPRSKGNNK